MSAPRKTYSNGVEREAYGPDRLTGGVAVALVSATRQGNGLWSLLLRLESDLTLPDGRRLKTEREVRVGHVQQFGRRSRRSEAAS